ncbi:diguanylate cyclase [Solirubrobacter ginsenosidimutans]|uniref:Diguanylate cyclase n=1 Tax=Solirubrobacter ginsenosidimutans TaxID=490573 RepID=A0A9X3N893_9ACTN|nr:diguanylate cyclase [Solirubrobacter ginsenosidimutans]MDA0166673.1 diguanylate cyclase [Solirubrobacter ginsenosidimutans]
MTRSDLTHTAAAAALELLPDGVLVVCDGEVVLANRALHRLTGEDLTGRPAPDWLPPGGTGEVQVHGRSRFVTVSPCDIGAAHGSVITVRDASAPSVLAHRASHDGLTGLLNQRAFRERLATEAARCALERRPLSLVVIDLDHFKAINDVHGHPTGDRVLAEAAGRIAGAARAVDAVGRIGGEEFAWLLPDDSAERALIAAQRLRAAIDATPFAGGLRVTASMGICDLSTARSPENLLRRADEALYWSKAFGRDAALVWSARTAGRIARGRVGGLDALAEVAEPQHGARVADLAVALAEALGWDPSRQARLHQAARLHDVGKAALPDKLLSRPGPLSGPELEHVRQHAAIGAGLAAGVLDPEQASWVRHHHERWDGAGYPAALSAQAIPEGAQLLALADAWDTMTHGRPYRAALTPENALAEIDHVAGTHLRPDAATLTRTALAWLAGT